MCIVAHHYTQLCCWLASSAAELVPCADSSQADLTVYGNVFVRPRLNSTNASSTTVTGRRRLQESGVVN